MYADNRRYTEEHEWIEVDDGVGTIGITQFAQEELGDVVFVELPEVGAEFGAGEEMGTIESVKAVSSLYIPVTGKVVEVNEDLENAPEKVNEDPHGEGWLVKIEVSDPSELDSLLDASAYEAKVSEGS